MAPSSTRSTLAEALTLGLPSLLTLLIGVAVGAVNGWGYFVDSAVAVALVLPVTLLGHMVTLWMSGPTGAFAGVLLKVILRTLVIVGGGLILFLTVPDFRTRGVSLWVWVIGVYLSTLAAELYLLIRPLRRGDDSPR